MGTLAIELIDHRNDVSGPWLLMVASRIGWLVAPPVAERVHARHAVFVGQRIDESGLFPRIAVHQQAVLQHDQRPLALDYVMNPVPAMNGKRHCKPPRLVIR